MLNLIYGLIYRYIPQMASRCKTRLIYAGHSSFTLRHKKPYIRVIFAIIAIRIRSYWSSRATCRDAGVVGDADNKSANVVPSGSALLYPNPLPLMRFGAFLLSRPRRGLPSKPLSDRAYCSLAFQEAFSEVLSGFTEISFSIAWTLRSTKMTLEISMTAAPPPAIVARRSLAPKPRVDRKKSALSF